MMAPKIPKPLMPVANVRLESDASHLIVNEDNIPKGLHPIGEIEIMPKEQPHISLGNYTPANRPKGFAIRIHPDPELDSIVTQITSLGDNNKYELVLHIANYGDAQVSAEVWRL
jgi:hypothetical protein